MQRRGQVLFALITFDPSARFLFCATSSLLEKANQREELCTPTGAATSLAMNTVPPSVSFITILDFQVCSKDVCLLALPLISLCLPTGSQYARFLSFASTQGRWKHLTESVSDLLGWEPAELRDRLFFDLVHPDELQRVKELHSDVILADKAATIAYVRLKHKDAHKGYIVCALVRPTWCPFHPRHLIRCSGSDGGHRPVDRKVCARTSLSVLNNLPYSSVSFAHPGGEALHINSTAQEVVVISTTASNFEFQRWHESSPDRSSSPITALTPPPELPMSQSPRTAFLLDRFSTNCTITRYTNHQLVDAGSATTRPFFDFVAPEDEMVVRSWLCVVKRCGVNDHGQPSSGGFSYGRFLFFPRGRQSLAICRSVANAAQPLLCEWRRMTIRPLENGEFLVDAIFSAHSDGLVCILRRATG
ncbi:unnamed protein product [Mycena citricolor]|uniref:PAS domain-containing protein n=1 Tax=Mycena citricolor TaxID=2018698 RepID=A0AAD2HZ36_9AGAR|nr:unnamed protein product [Mycena citricolor]